MHKYEELPTDIKDYLENLYYDGLLNERLYPVLIDNEQFFVIPDEFPEIEGTVLYAKLEQLDILSQFENYIEYTNTPLYSVHDISEEMIADYDRITHEIIREDFVENYLEVNYASKIETILNNSILK